jgi:putative hydrolase of the HAD superfamily
VRVGPRIRLVTFDVGGTLIRPHPSVGTIYAEVLTRHGCATEADEVDRAFERVWEEMAREIPAGRERYAECSGGERGYWKELLRRTMGRLGRAEPPAGAAEELFERFAHREAWRVFPEVIPALEALGSRGIRMAVISNWDSRLPGLLRELDLRRYFGPILVSALEGIEKPDPRIFGLAASRAGVENPELLHVGDREREDVDGARRAGCHAVKVARKGAGAEGLGMVPRWLEVAEAIAP